MPASGSQAVATIVWSSSDGSPSSSPYSHISTTHGGRSSAPSPSARMIQSIRWPSRFSRYRSVPIVTDSNGEPDSESTFLASAERRTGRPPATRSSISSTDP